MDRLLLVLRHAKSSWDDPRLGDHERPLAPRGREALPRLRRYLESRHAPVDLVLCSSAVRTVETLEGVRKGLPATATVTVEDELYAASAVRLVDRLRQVPDPTRGVLLVGHNPGVVDLVTRLTGSGPAESLAQIAMKYPTGALATLRLPVTWSELGAGGCTLDDFVRPRDLG